MGNNKGDLVRARSSTKVASYRVKGLQNGKCAILAYSYGAIGRMIENKMATSSKRGT